MAAMLETVAWAGRNVIVHLRQSGDDDALRTPASTATMSRP